MLAVSTLTNNIKDEEGPMEVFPIGIDEFPDFSDGNLLDIIDFSDLFLGMDGVDVLPNLEMDSEMFAEFSSSGGEESSEVNTSFFERIEENSRDEKNLYTQGEEIVSKREDTVSAGQSHKGGEIWKKSSKRNAQGKRKVKVDWTPELHRRFVQAVEQLGVDKAVPSRILELMGIDCLTRHNIASHLQKYRSHRKHLLAREAEAASWSHRRKIYSGGKNVSAWVAPISAMGFLPMAPPPPMQQFRPLHVWGHPSMDQSLMHMWPKHQVPPSSLLPHQSAWVPPPPHPSPARHPPDPSFWHRRHQKVQKSLPPVAHCFPQPVPIAKFHITPVTLIPPSPLSQTHTIYRTTGPQPPFDYHPSKESIDAAIGDVLSNPWSPLPLGLKPPSVDVVLGELQCQGIPSIPPSCA